MGKSANSKVLIIEDDEDLRSLLAKKLRDEKFDVALAAGGTSGLQKVRKGHFDCILLDLMMPDGDGLDFLQQLRAQKLERRGGSVIVISNLAYEEAREKALELGAKQFLVKADIGLGEIVEVVKKYTKQR